MSRLPISILLIGLLALTSCTKTEPLTGSKWYNSGLGLFVFGEEEVTYYPNGAPAETWAFDQSRSEITYEGMFYAHCVLPKKETLTARIEQISVTRLKVASENPCFLAAGLSQHTELLRMPKELALNFEFLSCKKKVDGEWKEVRYSSDAVSKIKIDGVLTLTEQLWLLFYSGFDLGSGHYNPNEIVKIELHCKNVYRRIEVAEAALPAYLRPLFKAILGNLE